MSLGTAKKPTLRLPPVPKSYRLFKLWAAAAIRRLGALAQISVQIDGASASTLGDGTLHFNIDAGAAADHLPFSIDGTGKVYPGLVGSIMPTLGGQRLDTTSNVVDLTAYSGTFKVWFTITFSVTYLSSYLSAYTISSVTVDSGTSIPSNSDSVKRLQFNTVTAGVPSASFFSASIPVQLKDNGANATLFTYT